MKANINCCQPPGVVVGVLFFVLKCVLFLYFCTFVLLRLKLFYMVLFHLNAFELKNFTTESQQSSMYSGLQSLRPLWKSGNQKLGINKVLGFCIILPIVVLWFYTPNTAYCLLCILWSPVSPNCVPRTRWTLSGKDQCCKPKCLSLICRTTEEYHWGNNRKCYRSYYHHWYTLTLTIRVKSTQFIAVYNEIYIKISSLMQSAGKVCLELDLTL